MTLDANEGLDEEAPDTVADDNMEGVVDQGIEVELDQYEENDWELLKKAHGRAIEHAKKMRRLHWEAQVLRPQKNSLGELVMHAYHEELKNDEDEVDENSS